MEKCIHSEDLIRTPEDCIRIPGSGLTSIGDVSRVCDCRLDRVVCNGLQRRQVFRYEGGPHPLMQLNFVVKVPLWCELGRYLHIVVIRYLVTSSALALPH